VNNEAEKTLRATAINVVKHRKRLGISQEAFADKAGIDRTYASQIERCKANPSLAVLCSVAEALGITLVELITIN
jgi:transcriptional regulator with XRE-family HTH domain